MSLVPIIMGSKADLAHGKTVADALAEFGIPTEIRVASAHKAAAYLLDLLAAYEADPRPKVYVTIAGRSNALSGMVDANVTAPVIACPPYADRFAGADLFETMHGSLGVGHNGNLTNAPALRQRLLERGVGLISSSDSEVIVQMLAAPPPGGEPDGPNWEARIAEFMAVAEGACSLVILTRDAVFAVRDPWGLRPLCMGELNHGSIGYVAASESCALAAIGAHFVREVQPGEIVRLDATGLISRMGRAAIARRALCVFEHVYFSRPDSLLDGRLVHRVRQRLGEALAQEAPAAADMVVGVPDSATPAAIGFARASGIPYNEGLTKNRYIGRTFIQPDDRLRKTGVGLKFNPLAANLAGQRIVLVDDSIVRGNTTGSLIRLLRDGGAAEVHVRVSSPPVRHPCFMGVDMATYDELIASHQSVEEIRAHIGADSLAYLSLEGMLAAVGDAGHPGRGHCAACFSDRYPVSLDEFWARKSQEKLAFEQMWGS